MTTHKVTRIKERPAHRRAALLRELIAARGEEKQARSRAKAAQSELVRLMDTKTFNVADEVTDEVYTATWAQRTSRIVDEAGLKKSLGAKVWDKVTRRVLDTTLLQKAMEDDVVDPTVVATHTTEERSAPYVVTSISRKHVHWPEQSGKNPGEGS